MDRFRHSNTPEDLNKAVQDQTRALGRNPNDPRLRQQLGLAHFSRFRHLGELSDLDKALEHLSAALSLIRNGDTLALNADLGTLYNLRFRRLGDPRDLTHAITYKTRALGLVPKQSSRQLNPLLSRQHASLAVAYAEQARYSHQLVDLEKAIEQQKTACDPKLIAPGHPDYASRVSNLGTFYGDRYRLAGQASDLEQAITLKTDAVNRTPQGHPDRPGRCIGLASSLTDRYGHRHQQADLELAIQHEINAIASTPSGHRDLAQWHCNLAQTLYLRYQFTHNRSHAKESLDAFRKASQSATAAPRDRFLFALCWTKLASQDANLAPMEAYQVAIDLLPQFIWVGASTSQRYRDLSKVEQLAVDAASAAIRHRDYNKALEWLEHARAVVGSQSLILRLPLDELQASQPGLAHRLQTVAEQLHDASSDDPEFELSSSGPVNQQEAAQERRRLAGEYDQLLAQAQKLPGFGDLRRPMKAKDLVGAARIGSIVVLTCRRDGSDALIIKHGSKSVEHLALPGFTGERAHVARVDLDARLKRKGLRERRPILGGDADDSRCFQGVLFDLWKGIVKPVLQFLGPQNNGGRLPHITWCPTGAMSFLPLHAAGDYATSEPGHKVYEYAISSYTPTLTALLASSPSSLGRGGVLGVGQANTPGHTVLPGTTEELNWVKSHMQNKFPKQYFQLTGPQATKGNVLKALETHQWVHFACHAHQNASDPLRSAFFLHDAELTLESINRRSFKNRGLAFLSACQTAMGDERLPDEAIHLASGMLMSGYPSVIATMWSINDSDGPVVANGVYAALMRDGKVGNGEAGTALHYAVAELRNRVGAGEFLRWVPFIHMGL